MSQNEGDYFKEKTLEQYFVFCTLFSGAQTTGQNAEGVVHSRFPNSADI